MRIVTARLFSTYETRLGNDYYEKDEAGLLTLKRVVGEHGDGDGDDAGEGELFPAAAYEPIALKKLRSLEPQIEISNLPALSRKNRSCLRLGTKR
jgi:hypothetical protein